MLAATVTLGKRETFAVADAQAALVEMLRPMSSKSISLT